MNAAGGAASECVRCLRLMGAFVRLGDCARDFYEPERVQD